MDNIKALQELLDGAEKIAFFGGAGVSTESGIPDFRSVDGLYNMKYDYPPEEILSHTFFMSRTAEFYKFYRDKMLFLGAKPNAAHIRLAELEAAGKLSGVITQNIDGLHQAAGSRRVYELHGSVLRNYCMKCQSFFDVSYIKNSSDIPLCDKCGGTVKPDVVLYEEALNNAVVEAAVDAISASDLLIIGGTSLSVYPASGLVNYFRGDKLVLINKSPTAMDKKADLLISDGIAAVFEKIKV